MARMAEVYWSDARLVKQVLAEDPRAFERLISRHQRRARAIARATGVRSDDLEDVIQESFVRAFEKLAQLRSPGSFRPWFLEIVRNVARSTLRRDARREVSLAPSAEGGEAQGDSAADHIEQGELRAALWRQVARLPESVREAIFLYYYEGRSVSEVARSLAISRAAVLKRLQRGREVLRTRLWLELRDVVEDMLPSARASKLESRRFALLVLGASALRTNAAQSTVGAAAGEMSASSPVPVVARETLNGVLHIMATKKVGFSVVIAALLLSGALFVMMFVSPRDPPSESVSRGEQATGLEADGAFSPRTSDLDREETAVTTRTPEGGIALTPPSVRGVVTDEASQGLAGATVLALPAAAWREAFDAGAGPIEQRTIGDPSAEIRELFRSLAEWTRDFPRAETGDGGAFELRGLPAGEYRLLASRAGYGPSVETYVVVADEEVARCLIALPAGREVRGIVVDADERPVDGAHVVVSPTAWRRLQGKERVARVLDSISDASFLVERRETVTDRDGRFVLSPLELAACDLTVRAEGYAVARVLDVPDGEEVRVVLSRGRRLEVVVTTGNGRGIAEAAVGLESIPSAPPAPTLGPSPQPGVPDFVDLQALSLREATTDRFGEVAFEALEPGRYRVTVVAESFVTHTEEIELDSAESRRTVQLEVGGTIVGVVRDEEDVPLADARVWIETSRPGGWIWWGRRYHEPNRTLSESRTGPDGRFILSGLPDGAVTVQATHRMYRTRRVTGVRRGGDLTITLERGSTIRGIVRDGLDRTPLGNARVTLLDEGNQPIPERSAESAEDGRFEIHGIDLEERDRLSLEARHPDYPDRMRLYPETTAIASDIEVLLFRPERVFGRVVDAQGTPVAGAEVHMESNGVRAPFPSGRASVRSSEEGEFAVLVPSAKGESYDGLELVATSPPDSIGRTGPLRVHANEDLDVEIVLEEASSLSGRVSDADGNPVAGAVVLARRKASPDGEPVGKTRATRARDDGTYRFMRLGAGAYELEVRSVGHARALVPALEITTEPAVQDIVLRRGRAVAGRVTDRSGASVPGAQVLLLEREDCDLERTAGNHHLRRQRRLYAPGVLSTVTDANGSYELEHVPEETWTLVARAPGFAPSGLAVVSGEDERFDLTLTRLSAVRGRVVEASTGRAVSYFRTMLQERDEDGNGGQHLLYREFAHPRGEFVLEGLLPATYSVAVVAEGYGRGGFRVTVTEGSDQSVKVELERGHQLEGTIVDEVTGEPIAGAYIHAFNWTRDGWRGDWRNHAVASTRSGQDGRFRMPGLEPASYTLNIGRDGYVPAKRRLEFDEAPVDALRVALTPAGILKGSLVGLSKRRFVFASIELVGVGDPSKETSQPVRYGKDDFSLDRVPAGTYRVRLREQVVKPEREKAFYGGESINIEKDTYERETPLGEVVIRPGETTELSVTLPALEG